MRFGRRLRRLLHQQPGCFAVLRNAVDVPVVLRNALVQARHFAEQVADDGVGPARQILQLAHRLAPHGGGLERQHDAELRQQAADAVEGGGALLHEPLAGAVHQQLRLLLDALGRNEAHVGAADGFTDRGRIGRVVLAGLARQPIGNDELGGHEPHRVAEAGKQARPVVRAR